LKLISHLFSVKFNLILKRHVAEILNAWALLPFEELKVDFKTITSICLSMDASNRKDMKLVHELVRCFLPLQGVKEELLDLTSVIGEMLA
jgi:hypothetical protein